MQANPRLGHWVSTQRHEAVRKSGGKQGHSRMTTERRTALEKIGFIWVAPKGGNVRGTDRQIRGSFKVEEDIHSADEILEQRDTVNASPTPQVSLHGFVDTVAARSIESNQEGAGGSESGNQLTQTLNGIRDLPSRTTFPNSSSLTDSSSQYYLAATSGNFNYPASGGFNATYPTTAASRDLLRASTIYQDLIPIESLGHIDGRYAGSHLHDDINRARLACIREFRLLLATEALLSRSAGSALMPAASSSPADEVKKGDK